MGYPFNHRDTDRVSETEQCLVKRDVEGEVVCAHQASALARGQEPHGETPFACGEENLATAAATRGAQAASNAVGSKLCHGFAVTNAAENGSVLRGACTDHGIGLGSVLRAHLV